MKKRYHIEYSGDARLVIDIDHSVFTDEQFKECSDFWSNKPDLTEWLQMVYLIVLRENFASISGTYRLREGNEEGFPKMDGSSGIEIIGFEGFEFDDFEIEVREVAL
jgi:hypothetical protein